MLSYLADLEVLLSPTTTMAILGGRSKERPGWRLLEQVIIRSIKEQLHRRSKRRRRESDGQADASVTQKEESCHGHR